MSNKKYTRSKEDVVVAGVIAGLAHYFKQDPLLFRIAAIAFLLVTGIFPGLIMYVIAWLVVPTAPRYDYDA